MRSDSTRCLSSTPGRATPGRRPSTSPIRVRPCLDPTLARTSAHGGYGTGTESGLGAETLGGGKRIIY